MNLGCMANSNILVPSNLPPSQGGKYVGFGSSVTPIDTPGSDWSATSWNSLSSVCSFVFYVWYINFTLVF